MPDASSVETGRAKGPHYKDSGAEMKGLIVVICVQIVFWICRPVAMTKSDTACETTCCTKTDSKPPSPKSSPLKWCVTCLSGCCFVLPQVSTSVGPASLADVLVEWTSASAMDVIEDIWKPPNGNEVVTNTITLSFGRIV